MSHPHDASGGPIRHPASPGRKPGLLGRLLGTGAQEARAVQSFRRLAVQLDFDLARVEGGRCLMLAPVEEATDASNASLELARTLAEELSKTVLLVDASLGEGALTHALGHDDSPGVAELLRGEPIESRYQATGRARVSLLPRGRVIAGQPLPLAAATVRAIVDHGRDRFEYVLIATDPVRRDSRCLVLPGVVDRVLLMAIEGRTLLDHLDASRKALEHCSQTRVGVVLTRPFRPMVRW